MKTYDRAAIKDAIKREEQRNVENGIWNYYDEWPWCRDAYYDSICMDDVRKGHLFSLLLKLKLKSPKEVMEYLNW